MNDDFLDKKEALRQQHEEFKASLVKKLKKTRKKMGHRTTPATIWLIENEDDTTVLPQDPKLTNGINTLNRALTDFEFGIALLAGSPNHGKSTVLTNMMLGALENNKDVVVLDFSFDDPFEKRYQQYLACLTGLTYQDITSATIHSKRNEDLLNKANTYLLQLIEEGRLCCVESVEESVDSEGNEFIYVMNVIERIIQKIEEFKTLFPEKTLIVEIDSWSDIQIIPNKGLSEASAAGAEFRRLANCLKKHSVKCVMSVHLKKTGGRRQTLEDVKGSIDFGFGAVWVGLVRNEYRENPFDDPLVYEDIYGNISPVTAIEILKTKVSSWDMPLFYILQSDRCRIIPPTREQYIEFSSKYINKKK